MQSTSSQQKNDCVIVAISNATGMSYDDVAAKLPKPGKHGLKRNDWVPFIESLGWIKRTSIPRRGQDKISGIVGMYSSKSATGHLVYMKDGIVFDSWHPNGLPIKEYQSTTTRCHIQFIWIKTSLIDKTLSQPDTTIDLDWLRKNLTD